jgi:hypothetical protein
MSMGAGAFVALVVFAGSFAPLTRSDGASATPRLARALFDTGARGALGIAAGYDALPPAVSAPPTDAVAPTPGGAMGITLEAIAAPQAGNVNAVNESARTHRTDTADEHCMGPPSAVAATRESIGRGSRGRTGNAAPRSGLHPASRRREDGRQCR